MSDCNPSLGLHAVVTVGAVSIRSQHLMVCEIETRGSTRNHTRSRDYCRFSNASIEQPTMLVAGIGPYATTGAAGVAVV